MSSLIASTSSTDGTHKTSKKPGLALNLTREASRTSSSESAATYRRPSSVHSLSNTPELEPDWNNDADADEYGDDDAQYVYIAADSPFYRGPSSPCTSSYLSVTGFPFACDALAEEDPLFAQSPEALFDEETESEIRNGNHVVIVDGEFAEEMSSRSNHEWNPMEVDRSLYQPKSIQTAVDTHSEALKPYF